MHAGAWTEKSQVVVETVTKTSTTQKFSAMPSELPASDASKVTVSGVGLRKATANKEAHFNVDGSNAGTTIHPYTVFDLLSVHALVSIHPLF